MTELVLFAVLIAVVAAVGIALGRLVAPRLERAMEPDDEEPGGGHD
jgi:hypothetical protein